MKNCIFIFTFVTITINVFAQFPDIEFSIDNGISDLTLQNLSTLPSSGITLKMTNGSLRLENDGELTLSSSINNSLGTYSWALWPHNVHQDLYLFNSSQVKGKFDHASGKYHPAGVQMKHYKGSSFYNNNPEVALIGAETIRTGYKEPARASRDLELPEGAIIDSIRFFTQDVDPDRDLTVIIKISKREYERLPSSIPVDHTHTTSASEGYLGHTIVIVPNSFVIEDLMTYTYTMSIQMNFSGDAFPSNPASLGLEPPELYWYGANVYYHFDF